MINFHNVSKVYHNGGRSAALEDINFKINGGEFTLLVGKSGAGKSTIVKLLIGEEKPTRGRVIFSNWEVNKLASQQLPQMRRQMGIIFQDFRLLSQKTAAENIAFAMEVEGRTQREIAELVPQVLDVVGIADKAKNFPHELSGGEKQRVAIARALVNRPQVIIADEPTGNLDPMNTWEIVKLLVKINDLGTTVLLATHSKDIINHLGRRVISMEGGRIIRDEEKGRYILS